jgi:AP endonuclease-2
VRPDLSADVAVADGYESFFAFPRGKYYRSGWSGVATFCRTGGVTSSAGPVLPTAAEEGFTGVVHLREGGVIADGCIGHYERVWAGETGSRSQLEELDQEGRVVVTDHGAFGEIAGLAGGLVFVE